MAEKGFMYKKRIWYMGSEITKDIVGRGRKNEINIHQTLCKKRDPAKEKSTQSFTGVSEAQIT